MAYLVTLKEIAIAINNKLKETFPAIPINIKDIAEGFERPSFTVDFENATKSPFGSHGVERNVNVIIYFFPTDMYRNKIEILETQEKLENAFNHRFTIKDGFVVYPDELDSVKVDGILQFAFDVHYIEVDYTEVGENMENLNLDI